jgi:hypothetical protein
MNMQMIVAVAGRSIECREILRRNGFPWIVGEIPEAIFLP